MIRLQSQSFKRLQQELQKEKLGLLKWWIKYLPDKNQGGFYGKIDQELGLHIHAPKGVIMHTRILWAFSAAARKKAKKSYLKIAERAYDYLIQYFFDPKYGGVYWELAYNRQLRQGKKQIYAQAFAIYALSEYYLLSQSPESLKAALDLYAFVEQHSYDSKKGGYFEAFDQAWQPLADKRLSEKDINEAKTMNTHLHLLEAYTNLYRAAPSEILAQSLQRLIKYFITHFIDPKNGHLHLFFDKNWHSKSKLISFGHDIECSWLLCEAATILDEPKLIKQVQKLALLQAHTILSTGTDADGGLLYEAGPKGFTDTDKHWWPQAEAMVGFINAYKISGNEDFFDAALRSWEFIKRCMKDQQHGEWYWRVNRQGKAIYADDKAGTWKAPYHNVRACLQILKIKSK